MNKITITATELKQNTSEILNLVAYKNTIVEISKHGKIVAQITPKETFGKKDKKRLLSRFFGISPNFPEVHKSRSKLKRKIPFL